MTESKNRKLYRVIGLLSILLLIACLYLFPLSTSAKLEVFNKTNYDLDSLEIDNKFYQIKKGQSIVINNCSDMSMQGGLPFGYPEAKINGKPGRGIKLPLCGTGVEEIKGGRYQFDIAVSEDTSSYMLLWQAHK